MRIFFKLKGYLIKQYFILRNPGILFLIVGFSTAIFSQITTVEHTNSTQLVQNKNQTELFQSKTNK